MAEELWRHTDPASTAMWRFIQSVNAKHNLNISDYKGLYRWSIDNVALFWEECWNFVGIKGEVDGKLKAFPEDAPMFPRPDFFSNSRLNFAENLLFPPLETPLDPASPATITLTELPGSLRETSWSELREAVRRCANALRQSPVDLKAGDIVAGYVSNHVEALVAMLAAASVGAVWTGISPDNGVSAVLDRLGQIGPKVLFADNGTVYNGKEWSSTSKTLEIVKELQQNAKTLKSVVVINNINTDLGLEDLSALGVVSIDYDSFLASSPADKPLTFEQLPPLSPFTSSTRAAQRVYPRLSFTQRWGP
uniref:AMP-dependent synthetase/ligase domain-containing protein n=1 Tax=Bionectria ochroleuca TaxID=29856 RepID=A0A8H7N4U5_BIOOC